MSTANNTTKINKIQYHHLTLNDRAKIQSLIEQKDDSGKRLFNNTYIAKYMGVNKSTISRELKRIKSKINPRTGKIKNIPYNASDAHENYLYKRKIAGVFPSSGSFSFFH